MVHSLKCAWLLLALVPACQAPASPQAQRDLIPRDRFFTFTERTGLKADPAIAHVYFRTGIPEVVHRVSVSASEKVEDLRFAGAVQAWSPTAHGLIAVVVTAEGTRLIERTAQGDRIITLPDGSIGVRILAACDAKAERFVLDINTADAATSGLYMYDLTKGTLRYSSPAQAGLTLFFDGEGHPVAAQGNGAGGEAIFFSRSGASSVWDTIQAVPWTPDQFMGGFSRIVSVSRDGRTIYYTSNRDTDKSRLHRYDRTTQQHEELAADDHADLLPFGLSFDAANRPTSIVGLYARTIRHVVDKTWESDLQHAASLLKGDLSFIASSANDRRWLVREITGGPSRILLYDRDAHTLTFLFSEHPELSEQQLATRKAFAVRSFDGVELPVHVYVPNGSDPDNDGVPNEPLPTVLYVHGGPWAGIGQWNQSFFWRNFQLLADRGYAVINCEFRGTTGLGKTITDKGDKAWRTGMVEDHASVTRWAIAQGIAKEGSVALWGWSFGGYSAMAAVAFHPELYAAGIGMYGISDQVGFARTAFADHAFWRERVGDPNNAADLKILEEGSPLSHIDQIKAPLFLTTGALDDRIPQEQMSRMADALEAAGKPVVYSVYPQEGHDYIAPESWISFWAGAETFLAKYLHGRAQPAGDDLNKGGVQWVKECC